MNNLNQFVHSISDDSLVKALNFEQQQNLGPFTLAMCHAVVFGNNLKHIHFHIKGKKFDLIHNLTEDYYYRTGSEADYLAELCMETGQAVPNFSWAAQYIPATIADSLEYNYETALTDLSVYMGTYVTALENLRNVVPNSDIQSKLDDDIRFWKKELNFKIKQRFE